MSASVKVRAGQESTDDGKGKSGSISNHLGSPREGDVLAATQEIPDATSTKPSSVLVVPWDVHHAGGVNQVVINLYRETFLAGEMKPIVMVNEWSAIRPIESVIDGRLTVHLRMWTPWSEQGSISWLFKWIVSSPVFLTDLYRFCRRQNVMVFNFQSPSLGAFPIALLRFLRFYAGDIILTFQGFDLRHAQTGGPIERWLWKFLFYNATAVVGCSRGFAADVRKFVGKKPVHAIHNGVNVEHLISEVDRSASLPAVLRQREFILSVATFEHKKGLDVLLHAFVEVRRRNPGMGLVLVGRSESAEPELRALTLALDLQDDVFFFANVPHAQVGLYLERARVFCLPSRIEPFGIAILEAGAYSLPVVASSVGGIPEFVVDGDTGLLVESDDANGLAAALIRILSDNQLAKSLGARLHQRVVADFSWRRAYKQYRSLLPAFSSKSD